MGLTRWRHIFSYFWIVYCRFVHMFTRISCSPQFYLDSGPTVLSDSAIAMCLGFLAQELRLLCRVPSLCVITFAMSRPAIL